jgi:hypothetical protein
MIKFSLCFIKHHAMAAYGEGKLQLHTHTFLTLALDSDELPALYPGTHQVGGMQ